MTRPESLQPRFFDIQVLTAETRFECTETGAISQILERELQRRRDMSCEQLDRMQHFVEFKIAGTELSDDVICAGFLYLCRKERAHRFGRPAIACA